MSGQKPIKRRKARSVNTVLNSRSGQFGELVSRARAMARLEHQLAGLLDSGMAEMVRVANVRDGCLVLVTPSAALANRLKMDQDTIIRSLNAATGLKLTNLNIRTAPIPQSHRVQRKKRKIPSAAKEVLARFKDK